MNQYPFPTTHQHPSHWVKEVYYSYHLHMQHLRTHDFYKVTQPNFFYNSFKTNLHAHSNVFLLKQTLPWSPFGFYPAKNHLSSMWMQTTIEGLGYWKWNKSIVRMNTQWGYSGKWVFRLNHNPVQFFCSSSMLMILTQPLLLYSTFFTISLMIDEINDIRNRLKLIPTFTSGCGFNSYQVKSMT